MESQNLINICFYTLHKVSFQACISAKAGFDWRISLSIDLFISVFCSKTFVTKGATEQLLSAAADDFA